MCLTGSTYNKVIGYSAKANLHDGREFGQWFLVKGDNLIILLQRIEIFTRVIFKVVLECTHFVK